MVDRVAASSPVAHEGWHVISAKGVAGREACAEVSQGRGPLDGGREEGRFLMFAGNMSRPRGRGAPVADDGGWPPEDRMVRPWR